MMTETLEARFQTQTGPRMQEFSRIKEVVSGWSGVRQYLRGGDEGQIVPVVIPKDRRRYGWLFLLGIAIYMLGFAIFSGSAVLALLAGLIAIFFLGLALLWLWRGAIVEIEQGTTGVRSRYGRIEGTLSPGRHYLWRPWDRVEFVVDTATEIPYLAPVAVCPTRENVPLKAIEFFLKFRLVDPLAFVFVIGASNFDLVLSSAAQDAIRQRSRQVSTEESLRPARQRRGRHAGLPESPAHPVRCPYTRRQHPRCAAPGPVPAAPRHSRARGQRARRLRARMGAHPRTTRRHPAHGDRTLQERPRRPPHRGKGSPQPRLPGRGAYARGEGDRGPARAPGDRDVRPAALTEVENEATAALRHLGQAHRDNRAVVRYELARRRVEVGEELMRRAPRPFLIRGEGGEQSAPSTLLLARLLPQPTQNGNTVGDAHEVLR